MKKIVIIACAIILLIVTGILVINKYSDSQKGYNNVTVRLVMIGSASDKSWSQSHYEGLKKTTDELGVELMYKECISKDAFEGAVDELITNGCSIIVCNTFEYSEPLKTVSEKYPETYFFHATGVETHENVTTFFGRIYQMRYLAGIVAGMQTETNEIGYVAAFPISEVNRGINAFTLGVRAVNPDAKVYVEWTESWTDEEIAATATQHLIDERNIDILTIHVDSNRPLDIADQNGVMTIGYNYDNSDVYPDTYLTSAIWQWDKFYTPHITQCLEGKFEDRNYWDDASTGIISIAPLTDNAKNGIAEKVEEEKERFNSGVFDVFYGPVYDNEGNIRIAEGESMTDDAMLNSFDWYVEGVVINE